MSNVVRFTMLDTPAGISNMYVTVHSDTIVGSTRESFFSGQVAVTGNAVEIDLGVNGVIGEGVIVSVDNYTSGNENLFSALVGYTTIEDGTPSTVDQFSFREQLTWG